VPTLAPLFTLLGFLLAGTVAHDSARPERAQTRVAPRRAITAEPGGRVFFAAPDGRPDGNGTLQQPWDLRTALGQPAGVQPGDTIFVRGGTYQGPFTSQLTGLDGKPILIRPYLEERVTLDGRGANPADATLLVRGGWTTYVGFEVTNSDPNRPNTAFVRAPGLTVKAPGTVVANFVVHDAGNAIGFWSEAPDSEISGCLIYYNGNHRLEHGIYAQNQNGTKGILDNIIFNNYGHGIHIYGSSDAYLDNFDVEGNIVFNNGIFATDSPQRNILLGGSRVAQNPVVSDNETYYPGTAGSNNLGYVAGCQNGVLQDNYFAGGAAIRLISCVPTAVGNTFVGDTEGASSSEFPGNTFVSQPAASLGVRTFVRATERDPGRLHVAVYNWRQDASVAIDLTGNLPVGTTFELIDAQNYFGPPVLRATYQGGAISVPMAQTALAAPIGLPTPPSSAPIFRVFVLRTLPSPRKAPVPVERPGVHLTPRPVEPRRPGR